MSLSLSLFRAQLRDDAIKIFIVMYTYYVIHVYMRWILSFSHIILSFYSAWLLLLLSVGRLLLFFSLLVFSQSTCALVSPSRSHCLRRIYRLLRIGERFAFVYYCLWQRSLYMFVYIHSLFSFIVHFNFIHIFAVDALCFLSYSFHSVNVRIHYKNVRAYWTVQWNKQRTKAAAATTTATKASTHKRIVL